jgi:hypothetical protein
MAWEEQRRLRNARGDDTAKIEGLPNPATPGVPAADTAASEHAASATGRGARVERWGQRFGWMTAAAIAAIALIFALLAFTDPGTTTIAHIGRGDRAFAPYGRPPGGFGGPHGIGGGPGYAPAR